MRLDRCKCLKFTAFFSSAAPPTWRLPNTRRRSEASRSVWNAQKTKSDSGTGSNSCPHKSPAGKWAVISQKCSHYMSAAPETLSGFAGYLPSRPIFASCHFLCLLLLIPAGEIRRSGASIIAPHAHRGVLSHTEIHISASFNLGCESLSHIYDCS